MAVPTIGGKGVSPAGSGRSGTGGPAESGELPGRGKGDGTAPLDAQPAASRVSSRETARRIGQLIGYESGGTLRRLVSALPGEAAGCLVEELAHLEVVGRVEDGLRGRLDALDPDRRIDRHLDRLHVA